MVGSIKPIPPSIKTVFFVLAVAGIGFVSCQQNESAPVVNKEESSQAVGKLFDEFNAAFRKKDAQTMGNYLSDDGLFLGSDPGEFWTKDRVMQEVSNMSQDTTVNANFTTDKREVRLSQDGQTALVVEQTLVPFMGKIPVRTIGHATMKDGRWKIDFYSWSLIPKNESMKTLSAAYQ